MLEATSSTNDQTILEHEQSDNHRNHSEQLPLVTARSRPLIDTLKRASSTLQAQTGILNKTQTVMGLIVQISKTVDHRDNGGGEPWQNSCEIMHASINSTVQKGD